MRRTALILVSAALLAWAVAAIVVGSPSLDLSSSTTPASSRVSPACLPATLAHTAALPGTDLDVSPAPETATANPHTQISFLGTNAANIRELSVLGSRSGHHSGHLHGYHQGDGASFLPDAPFLAGERVTVSALIGRSGRGRRASFGFRVDTPYPTGSVLQFPNPRAAPADYQSFYTLPGVQAPTMTVTLPDRDPRAGDILTTNGPGPGQYGPLIYAPDGRLIWFQRLSGGEAAENLSEQTYGGRRVLTWWKGRVLSLGFGQGEDVVMSSRYQTLARIPGGNGLRADLHDFQIVPHEIAYITAFNPIRCDLTPVGGVRGGAIVDTAIQQIDMRTGLVRWEWHSLDHVGAGESEVEAPQSSAPWDYFHTNSIDPLPGGGLLISARSTWAAYRLQAGSGRILWRLGGRKSSFKMGPGTRTAWQHDARLLSGGEVTLFDDGANPPVHKQSRGLRIALDFATHEARLLASYTHSDPPLLSASQGNMQTLPGGNGLIGYGGLPAITELAPGGTVLFDAHMPYDMSFYRAFRHPWSALPATAPAVMASENDTAEETIVHASWNGATGVASWRVLAGQSEGRLSTRARIPAREFESEAILPVKYAYVQVQALDDGGRVLGRSKTVKTVGFYASLSNASAAR